MADVTELLGRWNRGDLRAFDELVPLVYGELRRLAGHYMRRERPDHTLQPTALVNEAWLRLAGIRGGDFNHRVHFFGAAARAMRRVLVDHSRQRRALKRSHLPAPDLTEAPEQGVDLRLDLVELDDALERLAVVAPGPARVVELRYFGGCSIEETAAFLGVSTATVKRHWTFARAWLHRALGEP